jgi:SAM-dependent methyltransferase
MKTKVETSNNSRASKLPNVPMYDALSTDYDRFVDWGGRLASELPFIERQLEAADAHRVLDAACGTGMHAIALAQKGYEVVGADLSAGMIERARENGAQSDLTAGRARSGGVRFKVAGFGELSSKVGNDFDAVLCLGNSLPHLLTAEKLAIALDDFAACLRPGGLLLIQNRNFDAVLADHDRWMEPQAQREGDTEWLFLRFYDFEPNGLLTFNLVTVRREAGADWEQQITSTPLWPQTQSELSGGLTGARFEAISCFGDLQGTPFDAGGSPNLVVTAWCTD